MLNKRKYRELPLIYSCSGCSSAAQTANYIALKLDRDGLAEMSCIAGVGGNVKHLVNVAQSGRPILALDGCKLACALHCLAERGITPDYHMQLNEHGVEKRYHSDLNQEQADLIAKEVAKHASLLHEDQQKL